MATLLEALTKELSSLVSKDKRVALNAPAVNDPAPEHRKNSAGKRFTLIHNPTDTVRPKNIKE